MKTAVTIIDEAIKRLYNLSSVLKAEDFLLQGNLPVPPPAGSALLIVPSQPGGDIDVGIYLEPQVQEHLQSLSQWPQTWDHGLLAAFGVAAEEISHFRYLAHFAPQGRGVSQLELELQGEIDRFILTYFSVGVFEPGGTHFERLFQLHFDSFRWAEHLRQAEKDRYSEANRLAKAFLSKQAKLLRNTKPEKMLQALREFYRLSFSDKVTRATR